MVKSNANLVESVMIYLMTINVIYSVNFHVINVKEGSLQTVHRALEVIYYQMIIALQVFHVILLEIV